MPGCGALRCKNRSEKGFKLYGLPSGNRNMERRRLWAKYVGRDPLPEKTYICEAHFAEDQFELNRADGKKKLKWNAVPRIFAEKKERKNGNKRAESDKNHHPDADLFAGNIRDSSCLLQSNKCGIFEQVNIVVDSSKLEEIYVTSDEGELENINASQNATNVASFGEQPVQPFDLTEVCRVCFGKTQLENIFFTAYQEYTLHDLLEMCSPIKINKRTKFKQICVRCKSQLIENYVFVKKIITSNESLQFADLKLVKKKSAQLKPKDEVEEIFIFVDKYNKSTEVPEQCLSNSSTKSEERSTNMNGNQEDDMNENELKTYNAKEELPKTQKVQIFEINDSPINEENVNELETSSTISEKNILHLQDHTYVEKYAEELGSSFNSKKKFLCDKCGISLSSIPNLRTHVKRIHEGIKTTYSRCLKCNVLFQSQASYETHKSKHFGKHHCCEECGKMFAGMAHLRQHLRRHTTLRPFVCGVCGKSFRAKYLLNYHMLRHKKEKKCACPVCSEPFMGLSALRSHMHKIHPDIMKPKALKCEKCSYKSFRQRALEIHFKKTHVLAVADLPDVITIT